MADDGWDEIIETEEFFEDMEMLEEEERKRQEEQARVLDAPHAQPARPRQTRPAQANAPGTREKNPGQPGEEYDTPERRRGMGCLTVCLVICGVCIFALILDAIINGL